MSTVVETILNLRKRADQALASAQLAEKAAIHAREYAEKLQAEICEVMQKAGIKDKS